MPGGDLGNRLRQTAFPVNRKKRNPGGGVVRPKLHYLLNEGLDDRCGFRRSGRSHRKQSPHQALLRDHVPAGGVNERPIGGVFFAHYELRALGLRRERGELIQEAGRRVCGPLMGCAGLLDRFGEADVEGGGRDARGGKRQRRA